MLSFLLLQALVSNVYSETTLVKQWVEELILYLNTDRHDISLPGFIHYTVGRSRCGYFPWTSYKAYCLERYLIKSLKNEYHETIEWFQNVMFWFYIHATLIDSIRLNAHDRLYVLFNVNSIFLIPVILSIYNINPFVYIYRLMWEDNFLDREEIEKINILHKLLLGGLIYEAEHYGATWNKDDDKIYEKSRQVEVDFNSLDSVNINNIDKDLFLSSQCIESELVFDLGTNQKVRFKVCRYNDKCKLRIIHPLTIDYYILLDEFNLNVIVEMAIRFRVERIKYYAEPADSGFLLEISGFTECNPECQKKQHSY